MITKYDNEMRLEFLSKSCNEAFARIAVAAFASQLDPTIEEIADIKTAVSEAVTNSIIIEVSDTGIGIEDINIAKEPLYTSKPNLERSGMGFTIMQSFMDELNIESVINLGTKVTMKKNIKQNLKYSNNQDNICITA